MAHQLHPQVVELIHNRLLDELGPRSITVFSKFANVTRSQFCWWTKTICWTGSGSQMVPFFLGGGHISTAIIHTIPVFLDGRIYWTSKISIAILPALQFLVPGSSTGAKLGAQVSRFERTEKELQKKVLLNGITMVNRPSAEGERFQRQHFMNILTYFYPVGTYQSINDILIYIYIWDFINGHDSGSDWLEVPIPYIRPI